MTEDQTEDTQLFVPLYSCSRGKFPSVWDYKKGNMCTIYSTQLFVVDEKYVNTVQNLCQPICTICYQK